jgi:hypothetical protein
VHIENLAKGVVRHKGRQVQQPGAPPQRLDPDLRTYWFQEGGGVRAAGRASAAP